MVIHSCYFNYPKHVYFFNGLFIIPIKNGFQLNA